MRHVSDAWDRGVEAVPSNVVPRRLTRDEQREQNRGRLLTAAEEVFLTVGFNAASVEDIAERAGFTKGAFYSNFANKAEIFYAVLERSIDVPAIAVESGVVPDDPLAEQAEQAGSAFGTVFLDDPAWSLLLMEFAIHVARNDELRDRFVERNRRIRVQMADLIDQHLSALGIELTVSPQTLATILFSLGSGVILDKVVDPEAIDDELFGTAIGLLFAASTKAADATPVAARKTRSARS